MNDDKNNKFQFSTEIDRMNTVIDTAEDSSKKQKKKKNDYKNRAKWKLRKEGRLDEINSGKKDIIKEYIDCHTADIIKDYIDLPVEDVIMPYIVVRPYIDIPEKKDIIKPFIVVRPYLDVQKDIIKDYIEPKKDIIREYLEPVVLDVPEDIIREYLDIPKKEEVVKPYLEKEETLPKKEVVEEAEEYHSNVSTYDIRRIYFNFQTRVALLVTGILLLFGIACYLIISTLQQNESHKVAYIENSDVSYEVCQVGSTTCLKPNGLYTANTISKIKIQYQYFAQFDEETDYNLSYYVVGVHKIFDRYDANKISFEQEDIITKEESLQGKGKDVKIDVSSEIDYPKYHSFVEDYKKKYTDISRSMLTVALYVDDGASSRVVGEISVPLASDQFSIVSNNVKNASQTYRYHSALSQSSTLYILIGCGLILLSLFLLVHLTKLVLALAGKKSKYQEYLMIILNEYDRLIINSKDGFEMNPNKKLIKVYTFDELLEIRSVLNKPIIYSKINNVKSEFVVEDEEVVYKFVLKEADMGE